MKNMKFTVNIITYLCYFILIGYAIYVTQSGQCLWALFLTPYMQNMFLKAIDKVEKGE